MRGTGIDFPVLVRIYCTIKGAKDIIIYKQTEGMIRRLYE